MMRAELPYLAAGTIAVTGGVARQGHWPDGGTRAVIATGFIVVIASGLNDTKLAPLVRALGLLVLLGAVIAAVPNFHVIPKPIKKGHK
jgi:hypothetical protein